MFSWVNYFIASFDNSTTLWEKIQPFCRRLHKSDLAKWIAVALFSIYLASPLLTNHFIGAGDALMYAQFMTDAILQARAGNFPVYVGQSQFHAFGGPFIQSPYYYNFGVVLDFLTAQSLSPVFIQHLTATISICAGALIMYKCLKSLFPHLGWFLVALSTSYIYTPGVIGLTYKMDMYWSTMTIPYIPVLLYGLIRTSRQSDLVGGICITAALALLWPCHPPIALWCTTVAALYISLFLIFSARKAIQWQNALIAFFLFPLLNCWHFISVFKMGIQNLSNDNTFFLSPILIAEIINQLQKTIPGVFLPISDDISNSIDSIQMGYLAWFIGISSAVMIAKRSFLNNSNSKGFDESARLLICFLFLLILLYPFTSFTRLLWSFLPHTFEITRIWPMQRFYIILAGICSVLGCHFLSFIRFNKPLSMRLVSIIFAILFLWTFSEATKLMSCARNFTYPDQILPDLLPENVTNICVAGTPYLPTDTCDAMLQNTLYDRTTYVEIESNKSVNSSEFKLETMDSIPPAYQRSTSSSTFAAVPQFNMHIEPGRRYALSFEIAIQNYNGFINLASGNRTIREYRSLFATDGLKIATVWTSDPMGQDILWSFIGASKIEGQAASIVVSNIQVHSYTPESLPISIKSLLPYVADLTVPSKPCYLETCRYCYPGYRAIVNGKDVDVMRSEKGLIMIPLMPGQNHVVLVYRGAVIMRLAFYVNIAAWLALAVFMWRYRKKTKSDGAGEIPNSLSPDPV